MFIINNFSTCFGHHYAHLQKNCCILLGFSLTSQFAHDARSQKPKVCNLSCIAFNAHAHYCHLHPVWLYDVFPHYLINSMVFAKRLLNTKLCVLIFSTTFV